VHFMHEFKEIQVGKPDLPKKTIQGIKNLFSIYTPSFFKDLKKIFLLTYDIIAYLHFFNQ